MASTSGPSGPLAWASRLADSEERLLDTRVTTSAHRLNRTELKKLLDAATAAFTAEEAARTELLTLGMPTTPPSLCEMELGANETAAIPGTEADDPENPEPDISDL